MGKYKMDMRTKMNYSAREIQIAVQTNASFPLLPEIAAGTPTKNDFSSSSASSAATATSMRNSKKSRGRRKQIAASVSFLDFYLATDGAVSVSVSFQVIAN